MIKVVYILCCIGAIIGAFIVLTIIEKHINKQAKKAAEEKKSKDLNSLNNISELVDDVKKAETLIQDGIVINEKTLSEIKHKINNQ